MKVLVVDDSAIVRCRFVEALSALANVEQVDTAASSSEARRAIASMRPDLVILDIHMPSGGGLEVLDAARVCDPPITTIVLSNDPTPQSRQTCLRSGAKFFFDKSAECQQAVDAIARLALNGAASPHV